MKEYPLNNNSYTKKVLMDHEKLGCSMLKNHEEVSWSGLLFPGDGWNQDFESFDGITVTTAIVSVTVILWYFSVFWTTSHQGFGLFLDESSTTIREIKAARQSKWETVVNWTGLKPRKSVISVKVKLVSTQLLPSSETRKRWAVMDVKKQC